LYHNPGLYEEIISAKNILGVNESDKDLIISYSEVPDNVKMMVEKARKNAMECTDRTDFSC